MTTADRLAEARGYKARHGTLCDVTVNFGVHGCDCELATLVPTAEYDALVVAAAAAVDEWDAATKDWLEWWAKGGKGIHEFPVAAVAVLRAALEGVKR